MVVSEGDQQLCCQTNDQRCDVTKYHKSRGHIIGISKFFSFPLFSFERNLQQRMIPVRAPPSPLPHSSSLIFFFFFFFYFIIICFFLSSCFSFISLNFNNSHLITKLRSRCKHAKLPLISIALALL